MNIGSNVQGDLPEKLRNRQREDNGSRSRIFRRRTYIQRMGSRQIFGPEIESPAIFSLYSVIAHAGGCRTGIINSYRHRWANRDHVSPRSHWFVCGEPAALHRDTDRALQRIARDYKQFLARPIAVKRQRIQVTSTAYPRNPRFRQAVLEAYSYRCAMCGIQLGLVDAAHIVPHAHLQGHDVVSNGLALCSLHHRSFDTGLLYCSG